MTPARTAAETPLMRQYLDVKARHPDCVIFFRVGDFYEMFFEDAVTVSRAIDLTLTSRDKGREEPTPMCGVPHHAARQYLAKLIAKGFKVAICDQVEDPKLAKGIVRREVTRIVTPGVILDDEQLEPKVGCYVCALHPGESAIGLAWLDVSTGEFAATELPAAALDDELARLAARELLLPHGALPELRQRSAVPVADAPPGDDGGAGDRALLEEALGAPFDELGLAAFPSSVAAAAACVRYARSTQPGATLPLSRIVPYRPADYLVLDETAQKNLEIFANLTDGQKSGSLLGLVDETRTAMGGRLLRRWIGAPLTDVAAIRRRHDAVGWLVERATLRGELRAQLDGVYDLERLTARAALGVAHPRD
ncbi:MAG: DNA mismatch repair protein MutS, partial [Myxococcales bacterium]|nr:DNA mismatch repair protein MutS [Myxococcales bacterium]